ncbi:MAG: hypothetical protein VXZ53_20435, partial [Planctomycetota bacterium]|nr:hypothetical protein [Planctomycetota bacterium]
MKSNTPETQNYDQQPSLIPVRPLLKFQRLPHRLSTLVVMALTLATASYGSTSQLHAQIKDSGKQDSGELGLDAQTLE